MLSTKAIGSSAQASHYFFNRDDYYSKEGDLYERPSEWYGKGAELLELKGVVDKKQFAELLSGKLPDGEQIGLRKNGEIRHRSGFDLTFSAPKSWSIANYVTKDPRFDKLAEQAAKFTLDLIERDCAMAGVYENKTQHSKLTGNLVTSLHFHRLSRELDPQDHIHVVVKNMTQREDGAWRALKSDSPQKMQHQYSDGFFERVNTRKKDYGAIYRMQLAFLAQEAGFAVERTGDTYWELKNVPKEMLAEFSTRREQILNEMQALGISGAKAASVANLRTRVAKSNLSKEDIALEINVRFTKFPDKITIESLKQRDVTIEPINEQEEAQLAINYAINHLSEIHPSFSKAKLLATAMQHNFAKASINSLLKALDKALEIDLIKPLEKTNGDIAYVSNKNISIEKQLLENFNNSKSERAIVKSDNKFDKWIAKYGQALNHHQKNAVYSVLRSEHKINAIDGYDAIDKTDLITTLGKLTCKACYTPVILTVSKKEQQELLDATNKDTKTVAAYLKELEIFANKTKNTKANRDGEVLIIDGSHRLNTKQHQELAKAADNYKVRIIHLFDSRQPENFAPGNPMKLLKDARLNIANIAGYIKKNEVDKVEIKAKINEGERLALITEDYINATLNNSRHRVQVITQNKTSCDNINSKIQQALKEKNLLGKCFSNRNYSQRYLTAAQGKLAGLYKTNDLVLFSKDYKSLDIKKEQYYKITAIDKAKNIVTLELDNKIIYWNPDKLAGGKEGVVKTYEVKDKTFYENDRVFITKDFKDVRLYKGQELKIGRVIANKIELITPSGKIHQVKNDSPILAHLDLGYAKTAQLNHDKPDIILAEQLSFKRQTNVKRFYQAISQAKSDIKIYTDDKAAYLATLKRHNGETRPIVDMLLAKANSSIAAISKTVTSKPAISEIDAAIANIGKITTNERGISAKYHKALTSQSVNSKAYTYSLLKYCIQNLSEQEAVVTRYELEAKMAVLASEFSHVIDMSKLNVAVDKALAKGKLYQGTLYGDVSYTTPRAIKLETKVLTLAKNTVNKAYEFSNLNAVKEHLKIWQENNTKLSASQKTAVEKITTTKNGLILVNGLAGVGKTTMLSAIKALADSHGIKMVGLAPTNSATNEIKEKGIEAHTLDSYLIQLAKAHKDNAIDNKQKTLLILDESSMASTSMLANLLTLTKDTNTRLAFVGDIAQLPAVEQGKMFWFLQKIGIETTQVTDIIRQKNSPEYLNLVKKAYSGDFKTVLSSMAKMGLAFDHSHLKANNPNLNLDNRDEAAFARVNFLISKLFEQPREVRNNTRVVTPSNNERNLFNILYRKELQDRGELSQNEFATSILVNSNLSKHKKSEAINYTINQVIKFNSNITDSNIKKNDYLTVCNIDFKNNYLTLKNDKDDEFVLSLSQFKGDRASKLTVFNQENRKLAIGDSIRWRHTDKINDRCNMDEVRVIAVSRQKATIQDKNGINHEIDFNKSCDKHWDYAYAGTAYTEQGKTAKHVAILMTSNQAKLASKPTFIVALTRAAKNGFIVTDDLTNLYKRLEITSGIKTSALESLNYKSRAKANITHSNTSIKLDKLKDKLLNLNQSNKQKPIHQYNVNDINAALNQNAENIAISILGKPLKKTGVNLFFGSNKGSLAVTISGKYQGTFKDFDSGDKGNMLTLIQQKLQLNFKDALEHAAKLVNHAPDLNLNNLKSTNKYSQKNNDEITKLQQKRIEYAQKLVHEAKDIKGTLAEKYLSATRGIKQNTWPTDVKFHPGIYTKLNNSTNPALLVIARDKDNNIQAVQAIYLDNNGQKADVAVKKQTFGILKGALFCANSNNNINTNKNHTAIICEGPEDALSISNADNTKAVFACLGKSNFINVPQEKMTEFKHIILALDNDGKKPQDMPNIINAANNLKNNTNELWLTQPDKVKIDYNDILKANNDGQKLINNLINNAVNFKNVNQDMKVDKVNYGNNHMLSEQNSIKTNIGYKDSANNKIASDILEKTKDKELLI